MSVKKKRILSLLSANTNTVHIKRQDVKMMFLVTYKTVHTACEISVKVKPGPIFRPESLCSGMGRGCGLTEKMCHGISTLPYFFFFSSWKFEVRAQKSRVASPPLLSINILTNGDEAISDAHGLLSFHLGELMMNHAFNSLKKNIFFLLAQQTDPPHMMINYVPLLAVRFNHC